MDGRSIFGSLDFPGRPSQNPPELGRKGRRRAAIVSIMSGMIAGGRPHTRHQDVRRPPGKSAPGLQQRCGVLSDGPIRAGGSGHGTATSRLGRRAWSHCVQPAGRSGTAVDSVDYLRAESRSEPAHSPSGTAAVSDGRHCARTRNFAGDDDLPIWWGAGGVLPDMPPTGPELRRRSGARNVAPRSPGPPPAITAVTPMSIGEDV